MPLFRGLLVSSKRNFENSASSEIYFALTNKLGIEKSKIKVIPCGVSGLFSVKIDEELNLTEIIENLIGLEKEENFFMHCLKIKPIQRTTKADLELIQKVSLELVSSRDGEFRITITKRHTSLETKDIIEKIAQNIDNPVNLVHPDWIILIEILADRAGISVIKPEHIFSTNIAFDKIDKKEDNWFLN